ncbi:MAG: long-chain fatty acid--CoA ligase, partial [Acetatifactor sp.]|nr:long-chain fatty acid--CoA ligase [Acetatifactor sp.]
MKSVYEYLQEDKVKWRDLPYISVKTDGQFAARTFGEVIADVEALARGLILEGVRGNVMLYSPNSYYWAVADLAVLGYVGTIVPINSEWTAFDIERTLSVIEVGAILYSVDKQKEIEELQVKRPEMHFVCIESEFPRLIQKGQQSTLELVGNTDLTIPIMILFTSGTTNRPKAIPLTTRNLLHNWDALCSRTPMSVEDVSYIFLPFSHVYAGVANFLYTLISGMQIFLCSDKTKIAEEMIEVRPTIVCTVPLILMRIRAAMTDELMDCLRKVRFLYFGVSFTDPETKRY